VCDREGLPARVEREVLHQAASKAEGGEHCVGDWVEHCGLWYYGVLRARI